MCIEVYLWFCHELTVLCVIVLIDVWLPVSCDVAQLGTRWPYQTSRKCKTLRNSSENSEACCRGGQWTGL